MPERQSNWLLLPPKMRKDNLLPGQPKGVYRVKNWAECVAGLSERGNVSLRIDAQALASGCAAPSQRGRRQACSDGVIQRLMTPQVAVSSSPAGACQGFATSQAAQLAQSLPGPVCHDGAGMRAADDAPRCARRQRFGGAAGANHAKNESRSGWGSGRLRPPGCPFSD